MRLDFCVLCGVKEHLEHHHVDPHGSDDEENMITVCSKHHGVIHGMKRRANIRQLTKDALAQRKAAGVILGRRKGDLLPSGLDKHKDLIISLRTRYKRGAVAEIVRQTGHSRTAVVSYIGNRGL